MTISLIFSNVDLFPHAEGQVDQRLRLVLGGVLLRVGFQNLTARLARLGQPDLIDGVGAVEHPGDHAVFALVDRRRGRLAAHGPVDGLHGLLARKGWRIGLPARDLALARLAGLERHVHGLLHRLVDDLGGESEQRADAHGGRRRQVRDVVFFVFVQADGLHQTDMHLVGRQDAAQHIGPAASGLLRHGQNGRDVVGRMRVVGGQERIVEVQLAHGHAVGPGGPLATEPLRRRQPEERGAFGIGMRQRLRAGVGDRPPVQRGHGHRRVVDDPVDHHLGGLFVDGRLVGGHPGQFPGQLLLARQMLLRRIDADNMLLHGNAPGWSAFSG